jgi:hypothetical protein
MNDQYGVLRPALHRQVEMTIGVEVSRCNTVRMRAAGDGNARRRRKSAPANDGSAPLHLWTGRHADFFTKL